MDSMALLKVYTTGVDVVANMMLAFNCGRH
jgi:hypothetical protein